MKNKLIKMAEKAKVYTLKFDGDSDAVRVKIREKYDAVPINGLNLLKWCASVGAMIQNVDEIDLNKKYTLEFIGIGTHIATEFKKDDYKYCAILPLRTGKAKDILGNRVFNCEINNDKVVNILDDNGKNKIHEIGLDKVQFVKPEEFYRQEDTTMWMK